MNILFLGAAKRTELLNHFAGHNLYSCELNDACPIRDQATILTGPKFDSDQFEEWMLNCVNDFSIDLVIPNMDTATVAISKLNWDHPVQFVCGTQSFTELCLDKGLSNVYFGPVCQSLPNDSYPKFVRNLNGFGSRENYIIWNEHHHIVWEEFVRVKGESYIFQNYVKPDREVSVDAFFWRDEYRYTCRNRSEVVGGEVMSTNGFRPEGSERDMIEKVLDLCQKFAFGPLNFQYFVCGEDYNFIEINPRFGGGSTFAIRCGLDMPSYLTDPIQVVPDQEELHDKASKLNLCRARKDYFYES